jgi:hypothetical protein
MESSGWQVDRFASQKGYRILRVARADETTDDRN